MKEGGWKGKLYGWCDRCDRAIGLVDESPAKRQQGGQRLGNADADAEVKAKAAKAAEARAKAPSAPAPPPKPRAAPPKPRAAAPGAAELDALLARANLTQFAQKLKDFGIECVADLGDKVLTDEFLAEEFGMTRFHVLKLRSKLSAGNAPGGVGTPPVRKRRTDGAGSAPSKRERGEKWDDPVDLTQKDD